MLDVRMPIPAGLAEDCLAGRGLDRLADLLAGLVRAHVDRRPGFGVLTGIALDGERAREFTVLASRALGELAPQDAAGTLLREVRDRGVRLGEGATGRYSDSRDGGSLHTDAPHAPGPAPDWFTLFCVRQSPEGGGTVLVHLEDLLARLSPAAVAVLREPVHFDRREATAGTVRRPILSGDGIAYLREYVELGHRQPGVPPLTGAQRAALDELDAALGDPELQLTDRLAPGELAVFDNRRVCHGRTAFTDDPRPGRQRLLLRTWIRRTG
ncbi:MAG: hypothetical protein AVDCRST_MAG41-3215 [uncultured Corynebacteriales bacterium]|uniref:TauD/TfdA-like domain-containing protein n=1 Tax=uncultured Mycobacteriales bacterium TaxID=581187 RepID=A0A6J4JBN1_9ACTN|nr:MAG: hypothetical protein AVDCRST_MAG41-3215 [uncultured Corynebacteriales bacterium]